MLILFELKKSFLSLEPAVDKTQIYIDVPCTENLVPLVLCILYLTFGTLTGPLCLP